MRHILIVSPTAPLQIWQRHWIPPAYCIVETADDAPAAKLLMESLRPDCLIVDCSIGESASVELAHLLRENSPSAVAIGLISDEDNAKGFDRTAFDETFRQPFDVRLLTERVMALMRAMTLP